MSQIQRNSLKARNYEEREEGEKEVGYFFIIARKQDKPVENEVN